MKNMQKHWRSMGILDKLLEASEEPSPAADSAVSDRWQVGKYVHRVKDNVNIILKLTAKHKGVLWDSEIVLVLEPSPGRISQKLFVDEEKHYNKLLDIGPVVYQVDPTVPTWLYFIRNKGLYVIDGDSYFSRSSYNGFEEVEREFSDYKSKYIDPPGWLLQQLIGES